MTVFVYTMRGKVCIEHSSGVLVPKLVNTTYNTGVCDAVLAIDDYTSNNDELLFAGRNVELDGVTGGKKWAKCTETEGDNFMTATLQELDTSGVRNINDSWRYIKWPVVE